MINLFTFLFNENSSSLNDHYDLLDGYNTIDAYIEKYKDYPTQVIYNGLIYLASKSSEPGPFSDGKMKTDISFSPNTMLNNISDHELFDFLDRKTDDMGVHLCIGECRNCTDENLIKHIFNIINHDEDGFHQESLSALFNAILFDAYGNINTNVVRMIRIRLLNGKPNYMHEYSEGLRDDSYKFLDSSMLKDILFIREHAKENVCSSGIGNLVSALVDLIRCIEYVELKRAIIPYVHHKKIIDQFNRICMNKDNELKSFKTYVASCNIDELINCYFQYILYCEYYKKYNIEKLKKFEKLLLDDSNQNNDNLLVRNHDALCYMAAKHNIDPIKEN